MPSTIESPPPLSPHHLQLIYASALRQTQSSHTAQDITQAALLLLVKKNRAGQAPPPPYLAAWLLKTTHYLVKEHRRQHLRRQRRELRAASQEPRMRNDTPHHLPDLKDILDSALLKLPRLDRELIAQRYLQEIPLPQIARTLNLSENTTTKRLTRALEKLRLSLSRSGISAASPALLLTLKQQSLIHLPSSLTPTLPSAAAQSLARHLLHRFALIKFGSLSVAVASATLATLLLIPKSPPPSSPSSSPSFASSQNSSWQFPSPITSLQTLEPPSNKLLADLIQNLTLARAALKTLSLQSSATFEEWDPDQQIWKDAGDIEGQAWLDTAYPRRFRSEVTLYRIPWIDGAAPFLSDNFTETWDGQSLRTLHGPPHSIVRASLVHTQTNAVNHFLCGIDYSTQLSGDLQPGYFGEQEFIPTFDPNLLKLQNLSAQRVLLNGIPSIQFTENRGTAAQPRSARLYWFDPNRGYALLASQSIYDTTTPTEIFNYIDQLAQPSPGIFYPQIAHQLTRTKDPATQTQHFTRRHFLATKISINLPLDPTLFQLQFPPNLPVSSTQP